MRYGPTEKGQSLACLPPSLESNSIPASFAICSSEHFSTLFLHCHGGGHSQLHFHFPPPQEKFRLGSGIHLMWLFHHLLPPLWKLLALMPTRIIGQAIRLANSPGRHWSRQLPWWQQQQMVEKLHQREFHPHAAFSSVCCRKSEKDKDLGGWEKNRHWLCE